MNFESKKGPKKEIKMNKYAFCKLESLFFLLLFFQYSFSFALPLVKILSFATIPYVIICD
jgi:hypothetical protein